MSKNKNSDLTGQTSFFEHLDRNVERKESPSKRNDRGERDLPQTRQHDEERKMSRMPIQLTLKSIAQGLPTRLRAHKPEKTDVVAFANHFITYMSSITANATEENLKVHLMDLLKKRYHPQNTVEPQGSIDFVIRQGGVGTPAAVLFESKRSSNASDMIRPDNINRKALHELVLYYMQERDAGNTSIKYLVVSTEFELFIFEASFFERTFYKNTGFKSDFRAWSRGEKSDKTTDFFYQSIVYPYVANLTGSVEAIHVDLREFTKVAAEAADGRKFVQLFKILSPQFFLHKEAGVDSNSLNKAFYDEFLHIIGLTEKKDGGDKAQLISRLPQASRNSGSLLENTISMVVNENAFTSREILEKYGTNAENRAFSIALELCLTWMNRILFLKLLESQLVDFHVGNRDYKFLNINLVPDYDALNDLFFKVLAVRRDARDDDIQKLFKLVPCLNSSLFERTELEDRFRITALKNKAVMPIMKKTVLLDREGRKRTGDENTLSYLLAFLDAYDFGSVNDTGLKEASRTIINAAVLGLIFEKINGYQEGAIFTPGYITMYMARKVIQTTIIERFQSAYPSWGIKTLDDIAANIPNYSKETLAEMNAIIDRIKICDPAVGSGHFLVSSLNELIFVKAKIGILTDVEGNRLRDYDIDIENDELVLVNNQTDENFKYVVSGSRAAAELQKIQKALFHQKQKLIENCLFGVDINPNSVRICQLRLWIELLKNAYYKDDDSGDLETLPNIDINIKCGNSLLSRFSLDENLSFALQKANMSVSQYKSLVASYKETKDKETKREIEAKISELKSKLQFEGIAKKTQQIDTELASLRNEERQLGLFSAGEGTHEEQKRLDEIHARIEAEEAKKAKLVKSQVFKSAFEWRFEFPEVLDNSGSFSGFDIIIANPPYMNIQGIESSQAEQKEYYSQKYTTARGSYDLANLFFELASWIANPHNGNCIFIFPHKAFNSASASPLRERFVQRRSIKHLVHFGANQIFENAITYTCVALFNDRQVDGFKLLKFPFKADFKSQLYEEGLFKDVSYASISEASEMYGSNQWIFLNGESQYSLFSKLYGAGSSVAEKFSDVFQGIATSKDCLFISEVLDSNEAKFLIRVNPDEAVEKIPVPTRDYWVEKEFFKPFLMGRDVHRYSPLKTNRLVFFPYNSDDGYRTVTLKELKDSYPGTYRFVTDYEEAFKARESGKAGRLPEWHAYIYPKNREKFGLEKLVSMEICTKGANTTIDTDGIYHTTKVYSFVKRDTTTERYEYFSAIFNSKLFWWFLVNTGDTLQNDARTMKTNYVNPFPLPANVDSTIEAEIVEKVRELMLEKAANPESARIHDLERELDYAVYELYGLTEDDRLEVESSS